MEDYLSEKTFTILALNLLNSPKLLSMVKLTSFNWFEQVLSGLESISEHGEIHQGIVLTERHSCLSFLKQHK